MRLDPVSLKLFVDVVDLGSIAAAAGRGHIAAAAVSRRLSELEAALRTTLLHRTNKGVAPTPAGLALLHRARRLLGELDDIALEMRDWSGGTRGQVRVVANISAIVQFLPGEIAAFLARHPGVQVLLEERISSAVLRAVAGNEADVGICLARPPPPGLAVLPYRSDRLAVVVPRGHALAERASVRFAETLGFDVVGLHTGSAINLQLQQAAADAGAALKLRIQVTSYDALAHMVAAGLGVGVMPQAAAAPYAATLGIATVALDEPWAERRLAICVRDDGALSAAARRLVESLSRQGEAPS